MTVGEYMLKTAKKKEKDYPYGKEESTKEALKNKNTIKAGAIGAAGGAMVGASLLGESGRKIGRAIMKRKSDRLTQENIRSMQKKINGIGKKYDTAAVKKIGDMTKGIKRFNPNNAREAYEYGRKQTKRYVRHMDRANTVLEKAKLNTVRGGKNVGASVGMIGGAILGAGALGTAAALRAAKRRSELSHLSNEDQKEYKREYDKKWKARMRKKVMAVQRHRERADVLLEKAQALKEQKNS